MPGASSGGSKQHKDYSPGSYYSILGNNPDAEFPSLGNTTTAAKTSRKRNIEEYITNSFFDKNKRLEDLLAGPKFLVMKRNEDNKEITLKRVSPFTLQKSIENFAGETKNIKRMTDGSLLIETYTKKQADRLCVMTKLDDFIKIKVEEHPTLNTTKGTIYCEDLVYLTDDENCAEDHPSWSRQCPKFILEMEVQRIQTIERISNADARKQFLMRNPRIPQATTTTTRLYSSAAKVQPNTLSSNTNSEDTIEPTVSNSTKPITVNENNNTSHTSNQNQKETPTQTSKHIQSPKSKNDKIITHTQNHTISPSQQSPTKQDTQNTTNIQQYHQTQQGVIPKYSHSLSKSHNITQDPNEQQLYEKHSLPNQFSNSSLEMEQDYDIELSGISQSPENTS